MRNRVAGSTVHMTALLAVVMLLTGCGQRGPLVLPDTAAPPAPVPAPADDQTNNDEEDSER